MSVHLGLDFLSAANTSDSVGVLLLTVTEAVPLVYELGIEADLCLYFT